MIPCPKCSDLLQGGMDLVRHLHVEHSCPYGQANDIVDEIYMSKKKKTTLGPPPQLKLPPAKIAPSNIGMPPFAGQAQVYDFACRYQHLTADECEALKEKVKGKEKEYTWGTYGPKRDEELQKYSINNLSTQHLENILITQPQIDNELAAAILMLLKRRYGV